MVMRSKRAIFAVLAVFLVLGPISGSRAVDAAEIDRVRNKGVLGERDFGIIDEFVAESVQELMQTVDFTSVAKLRTIILSRSDSGKDSASAQYSAQFSESAHKYISEALEKASNLADEKNRFEVVINLLILVDGLEDVRLADLSMEMLSDENMATRYWAVHCISNAGIIGQLNSSQENRQLAVEIAGQLAELVESSSPEVVVLMAEFAAGVDIIQCEGLLLQIADMRINRYADWTVEYELVDIAVLKLLRDKILSSGAGKAVLGHRFGQLYSYAMQKYVRDINGGNFLQTAERQQLASVLVEIEDACIGKLLGMPQSVVRKAVEQDAYMSLLQEHNRLLGDETEEGQLGLKLKFDYGRNADGSKQTWPVVLPKRPEESIIDN